MNGRKNVEDREKRRTVESMVNDEKGVIKISMNGEL
jgi:hypothetical protein